MSMSPEKLNKLFEAVVDTLTNRIANDEATGSEYSAAIALLKNNNVTVTPETNESMNKLQDQLNNIKKGNRKASDVVVGSEGGVIHVNMIGGGTGE